MFINPAKVTFAIFIRYHKLTYLLISVRETENIASKNVSFTIQEFIA